MTKGFWNNLKKPIFAQAPMDGVSDAAFRYITDIYGKPALLFTEFTPVEGIAHGASKLLMAFVHHKTETPTIAQLYGSHAEDFYISAFVACEMGFDGIDINMGCPDKSVVKRGAGAGLILNPPLAIEIVKQTRMGIRDWSEGKNMEDTSLPTDVINYVKDFKNKLSIVPERKILPVSVKTRIGFDKIVTESWISSLLEAEPVNISIHGRTLVQMYTGQPDWDEIGKAAEIIHKTETSVLGNGNVHSLIEANEKVKTYGVDGVLIGRAAYGNPWVFNAIQPTENDKKRVAIEHCEKFAELTPNGHFVSLRKHLAWYMRGIENSHILKTQLMQINSVEDVRKILS